jgi:hypothetical protein
MPTKGGFNSLTALKPKGLLALHIHFLLCFSMVLDQAQELMVREVDVAPVTAYRFNSLASVG